MRAIVALISLGFLLVAGGCGSSTGSSAGEEAAPTVTAPDTSLDSDGVEIDPEHAYISTSWWMVFEDSAQPGSGPPPAEELAVFQEPAKPSDAFPSSDREESWGYDDVPERDRPGRELFSQARLLLSRVGAQKLELFGVPTEKGWVCVHLVARGDDMAGGGGGCMPALTKGVGYWMGGSSDGYEVFGVIANDVRGVRLVAGKRSQGAVLGRNAFYLQVNPQELCPTEIEFLVLEKAKGPSQKVKLDWGGSARGLDASFGCR